MKKTVVLGASTNPARYSYMAVHRLVGAGHSVVPLGLRRGEVAGVAIVPGKPQINEVDTVTIYLNAANQSDYYDYLLSVLKPRRIIFNPGAENYELESRANEAGIDVLNACTLVMLGAGTY